VPVSRLLLDDAIARVEQRLAADAPGAVEYAK
jgi:hypothetical protein